MPPAVAVCGRGFGRITISIADACALIQSKAPAPVILIDACNFLDIFRSDPAKPRVPHQEIRAAADLLDLLTTTPEAAHLLLPELIPREYTDHADPIQTKFGEWTELHDANQDWLAEACLSVALALPMPHLVHPHGIAALLRRLADALLANASVLQRDHACLDRAVKRLINKDRPSHKKEMKDSMNLEQCFEVSRRLQIAGFGKSRVWVSSNTNDFAQTATSSHLHTDLQGDFITAGLKYFTSLRATLGHLRAVGEI
jgi:hypothetical protein